MIINDFNSCKGWLEIYKVYPGILDWELVFSDENVVTSGLAATLTALFTADTGLSVSSYQIPFFQIGVSGEAGLQVSTNGMLGSSLTLAQYGSTNLDLRSHDTWASGSVQATEAFAEVAPGFIKKTTEKRVTWLLVVNQDTANDLPVGLNEVGLFSRNPFRNVVDASLLCAYRNHTAIIKSSDFALVYKWTIEF